MNIEENRLRTFSEWPNNAPVQAEVAARSGFFSTGQGLEVECWRCGSRISNLTSDLRVVHGRLDPSCPCLVEAEVPRDRLVESPSTPCDDTNDAIYKIDVLRLISFTDWPVSFISRESLAAAGFYYMRDGDRGDRVRCAWCGGELMNWVRGDTPLVEHLRYFPHCHYAKTKQRMYNNNCNENRNPPSIDSIQNNERVLERATEGVLLGVGGAAESSMVYLDSRERTFIPNWPSHLKQKPKDLAEAGFYYEGPNDQVRCFQCGGRLQSWLTSDNPWIEHSKWFPSCQYLALAWDKRNYVEACMNQPSATEALACGLQPHTLRKAISNRLRTIGTPFPDTESLIDAALHEQINEQSLSPPHTNSPLDSEPAPLIFTNYSRSESENETSANGQIPVSNRDAITIPRPPTQETLQQISAESDTTERQVESTEAGSTNLQEENRKLKEARICKVCMDSEVGIVFLPCGHLISCLQCAPCLTACPLCRAPIKGLVRTYLS